jgi:hypothetical protein
MTAAKKKRAGNKAPKGKPPKRVGRPSRYNAEYHPKIARLLAQLGKVDKEISKEIGISEVTLNAWKKEHPEFLKSLKKGKEEIDQQVENTLLRRALGYSFTETKQYRKPLFASNGDPVIGPDGKQVKASIREEVTEKSLVPDVTAQIFWLKNRRPGRWRDKHDVEQTGNMTLQFDKEDANL